MSEPPGPRGGFPGGCGSLSVCPHLAGHLLPHLASLLIHHSSHGLAFPQPPLSPRYLDLFLMLLLFFLLILLPAVKYLTFCSVIGILQLLPWQVPRRRPMALGSIPAAPCPPPQPLAQRWAQSPSSRPSIPAQPAGGMAGRLELRQLWQLEPGRIKVLIACDN